MSFVLMLLFLIGCNKPNPTPEVGDEIYLDLKNRAAGAEKALETEKKKLEGFKKDLDSAIPQTGAIKYAQKRYFETEAAVEKARQANKYYELAAESRKKYFRKRYAASYAEGSSAIDAEEVASYMKNAGSNRGGTSWDTKARVKSYETRSRPVLHKKEQ